MKKAASKFVTRLKFSLFSTVILLSVGFLFLPSVAQSQTINDPYCISEFSTFSDKVTEMTVDWDNNLLYFTGVNFSGHLYKVDMNGTASRISTTFASSAGSGLFFNYISTDIVYYNDSIYSNSVGSLIMVDLSPDVSSSNPHAFTGDIGAEAGMAVVGDKIYTTDGKGSANAIYEYDIASNTSRVVVSGLPSDNNHGLEYCEATDKLYLAISPLGIYEVDIAGGTYALVTDTLPNESKSNFAIDPTGAYAFVHNGATVYRYNLSSGIGEVFVSDLLEYNYCDLKFGPSSNDPTKYSLYIGGNGRIYEATGFVPATSSDTPTLTATQPVICPLGLPSTIISIDAADNLNGASAWYLYSGSCGGTLVASNTTGVFTVTPSSTTTYYVRGEGECNVASGDCGSITIIYGDIQPPRTYLTNISCSGESNGEIEVSTSGGEAPYKYSIDSGTTFQDDKIFTGLSSGTYNVVVQESNGCINTATVELTEPDPLDLSYTSVDVSCNLGNDGVIEITASGGVGSGYEYSSDGGVTWQTSNIFGDLNAGTYSLVVRDFVYTYPIRGMKRTFETTCETDPVEVIITEPTAIGFSSTQTEVTCNGGDDGSITLSASGGEGGSGSGTYQYSVDGSTWQDTETFTGLIAGDYQTAIRDKESTSCVVYGEILTITEPTAIAFTTSQTDINCNGGNEGEIVVTASGGLGGAGTATYDYSNDGGANWQTSNIFSNLVAGDYDISVRDQGQIACQTSSKTVSVLEPTALIFTVDQQDISCNGNNDGQIIVNADGGIGGNGSGTYEYSINGGTDWQAEDTFNDLFAGTYNVRIRDKENTDCSSEITAVSITETDPLSFTSTQTDVSCFGGSDGTINLTANGGSGSGYDYSSDNGSTWQTSNIFEDLIAADYEIMIRDQSNTSCESDAKTVRIEEPTEITFSITQYNVSCNSGDDGEILITANGGVGGAGSGSYQYSNDNGATWQDDDQFVNLKAGIYTIAVRDAVSTACQTASQEVEITEPSAIGVETTLTHVSCFDGSNGQIEVTATGGEGGGGSGVFAYSIDGGDNWQTLNIFTDLLAGDYSVVVRDQGNVDCTTTAVDVEVLEPTQITFTTETFDIACSGNANGKIIVTASGGVGGAGSGTYQYSNDDGYGWQDEDTFNDLFANTYQVLVRDKVNTNCATEAAEVIVAESDALTFTFTQRDVSCSGGSDGQIVFTASGGSGAGYQYSINGGVDFQESNTFSDLNPGRYTLLIAEKDNDDCQSDIQRITITEPSSITFTTEKVDISCFECNNGLISISAEGGEGGAGTGLYQYSIDNGDTWQDASVFTALYAGTYQVMVRDRINSGCEVGPVEVILTEPTPLVFTTTHSNISCNGDATGDIQITASGGLGGAGSGTYQYSIDDGDTWQDENVFSNLVAGSYSVRVRDKVNIVNVTDAEIVEITEPTLLEFTFEQTDVTCNGNNDGTIVFTASGGVGGNGSGTYSYSIDGGSIWQNDNTFESLSTGEYQLAIRDAVVVSCATESVVTEITEPDLLELSFTKVDANCSTNDDGEIHLVVTGGTGGAASGTFEYSIDDGGTWQESADFTGLASADYLVSVRDKENNSCSTVSQSVFVDLISPINLEYTFTEISCFGNNDGQIDMSGIGGSEYEFTIDGDTWQASGLFENLYANDYTLITRESANHLCGSEAVDLSLGEPTELAFTTTVKNATCTAGSDGEITVEASGGVGGAGSGTYQYSNDDGSTWQDSNIFSSLKQGDYLVTVRDKENVGCQAPSETTVVHEYSTVEVSTVSTDISCFEGNDGTISITASGGSDYEYSIDDASTWSSTNLFEGLTTEIYTVVVREQALPDCYTEPIELELEAPSEITFTITQKNISCFEGNDGAIAVEASGGEGGLGTATYEYSNDNGDSWQTDYRFLNLPATTYNVVVRDLGATDCQTEALAVELTEPTALGFTISKTDISCFGSANGEIQITATGGIGGAASGTFEYSIDAGENWFASNVFTDLAAATYAVTVRDKENISCEAVPEDVVIEEPTALAFTSSYTHADCGTNNNGEIVLTASGAVGGAGSATYQYSIDDGVKWQDSDTFSALSAATYTAFIRDKVNTSCVSSSEEIKIKALSPIDFTHTFQDISCPGSADGEIVITVSGAATYDYSIDNGNTWQASNSFTGLSGGSYALVVRDQATPDCESETTVQDLFEAEELSFIYTARDESCNADSDGKIEIVASGGASGTYEYTIDGVNWLDDALFANLSAGDFVLNIRDKANTACTSVEVDISLEKATELGFETELTDVTCYGFDDGEILINLTVGSESATYEYSIDNGTSWQLSNVFTNVVANFYYVGIREEGSSSCQPAFELNIVSQPEKISIVVQKKDETCDGINDGSITIISSGSSSGNCEFTIDNGDNFQDSNVFDGIGAGTYTVFSRDRDNTYCTSETISVEIVKRSEFDFSVSKANTTCNGASDGTITVGLSVGTDLTQYEFSNDDGKSWQDENIFTGLASGDYIVLVQKKGGSACVSYPKDVTIGEPNLITFTTEVLNESCGGTGDGSIDISAFGGSTLVYDYSADNGENWQSESLIENLGVATYEIIVRDRTFSDCQSLMSEVSVEKDSELKFVVNWLNVQCFGASDARLRVTMDEDSPDVDYEYSIDAGSNWQSDELFNDLSAGTYAVLVRRVGGASCQTAQEVIITQPDLINFTVVKTDIICANDGGGSIDINATGGKSKTYQYSNDDGSTWQDEKLFSGLDAGSYLVWVRDKENNDCQSNPQNVVLDSSPEMSLTVSTYDLWCNSSADGEINATGSGGSGALTYSIDGGLTYQASGIFTGLDAGDYTVVLKDENDCELFYSKNPVTLSEPQGVTFNSVDITYGTCTGGLGSIDIDASSLFGTMLYSIDGGANYVSTSYFGDLSSDTYNIVVKENDGCENAYKENPIELTLASELSVTIVATPDDNICTYYPITLTAEGPDIASYSWSTMEDTESINFSTDTPGSYDFTVDVVSDHGCTASDAITLDFNAGSPISILTDPVKDEYCTKDKVTLTASADDAFSYLWKPADLASNTIVIEEEDAGTFMYYIEVTNNTGCISMDSVQLIYKDCTGLNELDVDGVEINIFPNPTNNGQFKVEINGLKEEVEVWIIDFDGRVILEDEIPYHNALKLQKQFDLQGFERGVYFIRLATEEKVSYKRIILM